MQSVFANMQDRLKFKTVRLRFRRHIARYELRKQLQTYRELEKYRQLMRSTWRIETMVLPELS